MDVLAQFCQYIKLKAEEDRDMSWAASADKDPVKREIHQHACMRLYQVYDKFRTLFPGCEESDEAAS